MITTIKVVNDWEIKLDDRQDNTNIAPYSIKYGSKRTAVYVFKTLKEAEKWANKH